MPKTNNVVFCTVEGSMFRSEWVECTPTGVYQLRDDGDMVIEVEYVERILFIQFKKKVMRHEDEIMVVECFSCRPQDGSMPG